MKDKILSALETFRSLDHEMAAVSSVDSARLTELAKERKRLEPVVQVGEAWLAASEELESLDAMLRGNDPAMAALAQEEKPSVQAKFNDLTEQLRKLFHPRDPNSDKNTIIEIRAGAGGDEAGLFAAELYRLYTRFAQSKGLSVSTMSMSGSGVGGMKEVIFEVSGPNAYGWFRFEQGVHRVQRVPQTEAQGRVHTSTVTVAVLPEPTEVEIKVDAKDLKIDTYRASGAGGQHVNKTESAIRITHIPTGVVVACQEERSQGQNKLRAMAMLRAKIQEAENDRLFNERRDMRRKQIGSGDRSEKIRTYNFPQDRITDHRINFNAHNLPKIMEGNLDELYNELESRERALFEEPASPAGPAAS
jgi:peptide chain release factor 1